MRRWWTRSAPARSPRAWSTSTCAAAAAGRPGRRPRGGARSTPPTCPPPTATSGKEQLTRLAAQGITVLTNRDGVLPLARSTRVALIGRHAVETIDMGGGSAQVNPPYQVSVAEGLRALLGDAVTVADGVEVRTRAVQARPGVRRRSQHRRGRRPVQWLRRRRRGARRAARRAPRRWSGFDDDYDRPVAAGRFRARIAWGGDLEVGTVGVGSWRLRVGDDSAEFDVEPVRSRLRRGDDRAARADVRPRARARHRDRRDRHAAERPALGLRAGMFSIVARPAPRPRTRSSPQPSTPRAAPTSPSSWSG